jgi:hypothetical protein
MYGLTGTNIAIYMLQRKSSRISLWDEKLEMKTKKP